MRFAAWAGLSTVLILSSAMLFAGQAAESKTPAEVIFQFERPGLSVPSFTIRLREDGTGSYQAEQAERAATGTLPRREAAQHIDRTLQLSAATVAKIFKAARELHYFDTACASKAKNIADSGKKALSYTGGDGHGSCVYNYSENKSVEMLGSTFIAIAYTMDEGRKLEFLHRYDRLGLDAEMITLTQEADEGRALEFGTISQTLSAIADDMAVMERVRLRAIKLLDEAK